MGWPRRTASQLRSHRDQPAPRSQTRTVVPGRRHHRLHKPPTRCAISYSPGSRPRASTTRPSSPAAATLPGPRPARLTPARRQRCAPGATPGNPGHAHQREHPARSRPGGGPGRELAVLTAVFTIRAPGPAAGEPALSPCLVPAAPGTAQINRSRAAPVMVNGARSADPNGGSVSARGDSPPHRA
jgi:hypothetical protein